MGAFEVSDALLLPDDGSTPIRFNTSYLPSGGFGLHWHPTDRFQAGIRVITNHDLETRTRGMSARTGLLRSYEYRIGAEFSPWAGALLDAGMSILDRSNEIDHTTSFDPYPTIGFEQALVRKRVWGRIGLDETTGTLGMSVAFGVFKLDLAYLYNLGAARTGGVFGQRNASLIGTIGFDYERALHH